MAAEYITPIIGKNGLRYKHLLRLPEASSFSPGFAFGGIFCYNYCIMQNNVPGHAPDFIEVLRTFNPADIAFIKSILEENDVVYYINNENVPFVGGLALAEPMRVMVEAAKYDQVKELLQDFQGNYGTFSFDEEPPPEEPEEGSRT